MSAIATTPKPTAPTPTNTVRAGLALSAVIGLANLVFLSPDIDWGAETPPYPLLVLAAAVGMVSVVCAVIAWRSENRQALRLNAAALIFNALMVLPAFFTDASAFITVTAALFVVSTVVAVILTMRRSNELSPVVD